MELDAEKNNVKSLRNFKLKAIPLITVKTENIKKDPDCGTIEAIVESNPSSATSANHDLVCVKSENMEQVCTLEDCKSKLLYKIPVKCLIEEPYECMHCNYNCLHEEQFQEHMAVHIMEKPFGCELCQFITKHKCALKVHMLTHTKEKRICCEFCAFKTSYKGSLKAHMHTHTKIKHFHCEYCLFKTCYEGSLKTHMQTHTGEKQFNCDFCSFKTNFKKRHDQHMLSHTGKKSFFCDMCPFKTRKKGAFRAHILGHTRPFKCPLCLYETYSENLHSNHMINCCVLIRRKQSAT